MTRPPLLPQKYFDWIATNWSLEDAHRIDKEVIEGTRSAEDVIRAIDRPDMEPENWQAFEDGWRPDGW
ncbi:hypothetical protein ASH01_11495 [Terrabacter sp. Soil811]|uniref:hypothetical protein n=1 Tax=Terrabacter sp. Soil811 TaxID=1736419 RepID=UPI0006F9E0B9|nr:hypothetical protein [Terrabacter sp. Soil811]KRF44609.1 hypothetical protein ASH01_11495 [Terrabacter sp. Soil811]